MTQSKAHKGGRTGQGLLFSLEIDGGFVCLTCSPAQSGALFVRGPARGPDAMLGYSRSRPLPPTWAPPSCSSSSRSPLRKGASQSLDDHVGTVCPFASPTLMEPRRIVPLTSRCPQEEEWRQLMNEELEAARKQGAVGSGSDDGIVLLVSKEGKVLRRGVGIPVWDMIREDVDSPKGSDKK